MDISPLINREIRDTLYLARYGRLPKRHSDSLLYKKYSAGNKMLARMLADRIIIKHYDFAPLALAALKPAIVMLLPLVQKVVIGAVTAGIAGAISSPINQHITGPIVERLKKHGQEIINSKGKDETYIDAAVRGFKSDMDTLLNILKREKNSSFVTGLTQKISNIWNKVRGIIK